MNKVNLFLMLFVSYLFVSTAQADIPTCYGFFYTETLHGPEDTNLMSKELVLSMGKEIINEQINMQSIFFLEDVQILSKDQLFKNIPSEANVLNSNIQAEELQTIFREYVSQKYNITSSQFTDQSSFFIPLNTHFYNASSFHLVCAKITDPMDELSTVNKWLLQN